MLQPRLQFSPEPAQKADSLEFWMRRLYNLRRDKRGTHERPHKPVLLLSVIDLLDRGEIGGNQVTLSDQLIKTFKRYFNIVRKEDDQPNIDLPFYHLNGDKLWTFKSKPGEGPLYVEGEAGRSPSIAAIRRRTEFAQFDPGLWKFLSAPATRQKIREALIARYFPNDRARLLEIAALPVLSAEQLALNENADPKRDSAFRDLILEIYDFRCCACGIRVLLDNVISLAEAAHLIPFSQSFNDHPSNGIALCPNHHWAMDRNLIAPCPDPANPAGIWKVASRLDDRIDSQKALLDLQGRNVIPPTEKKFLPSRESLAWRSKQLEPVW